MHWLMLTNEKQLSAFHQQSFNSSNKGVLLLKHSTRCSISDMALNRLERSWNIFNEILPTYYLDLLEHPNLSSNVTIKYGVPHESPQVLIIKNGICIYTASHSGITFGDIQNLLLSN